MTNKSINYYTKFSAGNPFCSQAKLLFHADRVHEYMKIGDTWPIFMEINLTDRCNLKCKWCISDNRRGNNFLNTEILKKFLYDFSFSGGKAVTFSGGGEPTLHNDFVKIACYANEYDLDLGLMTNGVFNEKLIETIGNKFKWIRISLDTINQGIYKKTKGIDCVDQVLFNIKKLHKYPVRLGLNCNVSMYNKTYDIADIIKLKDYCDYIQFRPVLPRFFKKEKIELNKEIWDFLINFKDDEKINLSLDKLQDLEDNNLLSFNKCEGHFFSPILDANGDIKVCMYHPGDKRFTFGNIYNSNFYSIWKSDRRKKVIEFIRRLDYKNECQPCCKLTELNKLITFLNNPNSLDINFL